MLKSLNKYRIKDRLVRAFCVASGIPAAVAIVTLIATIVIARIYANALENYGFSQGDVGKTMAYFSEIRSSMRGAISFTDEEIVNKLVDTHDRYVDLFEESFAELEKTMVSEENKKIYKRISSELEEFWKLDKEIMDLGATSDPEASLAAQQMATSEMLPVFEGIFADMTSIMDIKVDKGNSISKTISFAVIITAVIIAVVIVIAIWMSINLGVGIARGISKPLTTLGDRMESFAQGDLSAPFPTAETEDEVSDMVKSARDMAEKIIAIISDVEHVLGKMADSDYTVRTKNEAAYTGEFEQLIVAMRNVRNCMIDTIRFIGESSVQVSAGSGNLAETSQSLAEGATEQAGAVQELQATITTIADASREAAASAEDAYHQAQKYADVADASNADIREMVEAMERINETSQKIGNIISEIESIASQTNLLSLNASIEAARAGEAGRGFSVVADQIRQLAEQSSKSAVDTRTLIEDAIREVENGNKVAGRAVASIETVVGGIREIAETSQSLAEASTTQAATTKEAEIGITQISDVVQTNAAVAEESSATSEELSAQAEQLDALIAKFILPDAT